MGDDSSTRAIECCVGDVLDAALFKALCEPLRVELLTHLAVHGAQDVGEIAGAFPKDRSVISRHLQQLADAGLLHREKRSRHVLYSVNGDNLLGKMEQMLEQVRSLVQLCCPPPDGPT